MPIAAITDFRQRLAADQVEFEATLALIDQLYHYTPTRFRNGVPGDEVVSEAGQNEGSCRIFAFALLNGLSPDETLKCFGRHYRDVLTTPAGTDHANIRSFQRHGWAGIHFDHPALTPRSRHDHDPA